MEFVFYDDVHHPNESEWQYVIDWYNKEYGFNPLGVYDFEDYKNRLYKMIDKGEELNLEPYEKNKLYNAFDKILNIVEEVYFDFKEDIDGEVQEYKDADPDHVYYVLMNSNAEFDEDGHIVNPEEI